MTSVQDSADMPSTWFPQPEWLALFEQSPGEYVSGQRLSESMNCSRTAVWKQIRKLMRAGYEFEAVPRRGYRLIRKPDVIDLDRLRQQRNKAEESPHPFGDPIHYCRTLTSTQDEARRLARQGAPAGTLIVAEEQTQGRGRMGRDWHSPFGKGLWMSMIWKPPIALPQLPQLTLVIAVALSRAVRKHTGLVCDIKWPNDLYANDRKISGILLESSAEDNRLRYVIAGIGISVNLSKEDYPNSLLDKATSIRIETGRQVDRTELMAAVLNEWQEMYQLYLEQGFGPIRLMWEALSATLQQPITLEAPGGPVSGTAIGLDEWGALIVQCDDGSRKHLFTGLVV